MRQHRQKWFRQRKRSRSSRPKHARTNRRCLVENLEPRLLLACQLFDVTTQFGANFIHNTVATVVNSVVFFLALVFWGFSYWAAIPPTYTLLAERSRYPQQRAGDAQAVMAAGRVLGPLAAGVLLDNAAPWVLALLAAVLMGSAALTVAVVRRSPSTT